VLKYVDSEELSDVNENSCCPPTPATNAFDGDPNTFWNTEWFTNHPAHPHEIQIDLGADYSISGFRHLPRQDVDENGDVRPNGRIGQYEFYVSSTVDETGAIVWGAPVSSDALPDTAAETEVSFTPKIGHYVRLVAVSNYSADGFSTSLAELNLLTDGTPDSAITDPANNVTVSVGDSVNFAGSGTDPNNGTSLSYHWSFGVGSGVPDSIAQNPGMIQFNTSGVFTVSLTVSDSLGFIDPSPATRTVTVLASAQPAISQAGWTLHSRDSEELIAGEWGPATPATNAFDGDPATFWHTEWVQNEPPQPHDIRINLGAVYNITGFRHLPRQDGHDGGRIGQYEFYISTDGITWGAPVATGFFPETFAETEVRLPQTSGQYIWLRALTSIPAGFATSVAEINVLANP
jgi:hypothetical protein